jgi:hypothetical protein
MEKNLGMACYSRDGRKCKIGGLCSRLAWAKCKKRKKAISYLQNNQSKKGRRYDSNGRAPD